MDRPLLCTGRGSLGSGRGRRRPYITIVGKGVANLNIDLHIGKGPLVVKCSACDHRFEYFAQLQAHWSAGHTRLYRRITRWIVNESSTFEDWEYTK